MHISSYTRDYLGNCHWLLADFMIKSANSKLGFCPEPFRIERVNRGKFRDQFTTFLQKCLCFLFAIFVANIRLILRV
jgi:hypothetical protein